MSAQELFIFIADISGYTDYMIKNKTDYSHGTQIILKLLDCLIKEISLPFEIAKLEGDAIFLYILKDKLPADLALGKKILHFFDVFLAKVKEMQNNNDCPCGACSNIGHLNLKVIGHYGSATIDKIGKFEELSGVDVILAHRLLKNEVPSKRYLLLTEQAYRQIALEGTPDKREEKDKDLGAITIYVFYPHADEMPPLEKPSRLRLFWTHVALFFGDLFFKCGLRKKPHCHNLPPPQNKN